MIDSKSKSYPFLALAQQFDVEYAMVLECVEMIEAGRIEEYRQRSEWHADFAFVVYARLLRERKRQEAMAA